MSRARRRARRGSRPRTSSESSPRPSAFAPPPIRSAETWRSPPLPAASPRASPRPGRKPSCDTSATRSSLSGSSRKLPGLTVRVARARRDRARLRTGRPARPSERRRAMALTVKSRRPMSSSTDTPGPPRSGSRGALAGASARRAAASARCRSERVPRRHGRAGGSELPRADRAPPCPRRGRAAGARRPSWSTPGTRKSSSACSIPSSSSRTAPPTTYASTPSERM